MHVAQATSEATERAGGGRAPLIVTRQRGWQWPRVTMGRLAEWVLLIALATAGLVAGIELRAWYFIESGSTYKGDVSIRFEGDIHNAFRQGGAIYWAAQSKAREAGRERPTLEELLRAYRDRYDIVVAAAEARNRRSSNYSLDYPPARLLTMTLWVWHVRGYAPDAERWVDADLWPLLHFNTVLAALGAVGVFLLVRWWGMRAWGVGADAPHSRGWDAIWGPFVAACLFWFNAALLSNAHTWPQWDVWLMPGYIWAAYFASRGWWFSAGVSIALACVFKGQILIVAPVLLLWPLFQGKLIAVVRAVVGFAFAMAMMTAVWLYGGAGHGWWLAGVVGSALAVMAWVSWRNWRARRERVCSGQDAMTEAHSRDPERWPAPGNSREDGMGAIAGASGSADLAETPPWGEQRSARTARWRRWLRGGGLVMLGAVVLLAVWPWWGADEEVRVVAFLLLAGVMALPVVYSRGFRWGTWLAGMVAAALLLGPVLFEGSFAWARVGFLGPTDNHRAMHMGLTFNLAAILERAYRFRLDTEVEWAGMTIQHLSRVIYGALLLLTGAGLAWHAARRDRATLVALVTPWLVMFAVLMQMHERYLTYAAAISAILVGYRWGFVLLHGVITLFAMALLHHPGVNAGWWPEMHELVRGMYPGASWAVLLLAAVFVWVSVMPERRRHAAGRPRAVAQDAAVLRLSRGDMTKEAAGVPG